MNLRGYRPRGPAEKTSQVRALEEPREPHWRIPDESGGTQKRTTWRESASSHLGRVPDEYHNMGSSRRVPRHLWASSSKTHAETGRRRRWSSSAAPSHSDGSAHPKARCRVWFKPRAYTRGLGRLYDPTYTDQRVKEPQPKRQRTADGWNISPSSRTVRGAHRRRLRIAN